MMPWKQNSVTVIFRSEYCIDLIDSLNQIDTETAQNAILVICDVI